MVLEDNLCLLSLSLDYAKFENVNTWLTWSIYFCSVLENTIFVSVFNNHKKVNETSQKNLTIKCSYSLSSTFASLGLASVICHSAGKCRGTIVIKPGAIFATMMTSAEAGSFIICRA